MEKTNRQRETKEIIINSLPRGGFKRIYEELIKRGTPKSLGYIRKVLSLKYDYWNEDITREAIKICQLNIKNIEDTNKSVKKLKEKAVETGVIK